VEDSFFSYEDYRLIGSVAIVDLNSDGKFEILLSEFSNVGKYKVYSLKKIIIIA